MYDLDQLCEEHNQIIKNMLCFGVHNDYHSHDMLYHYTSADGFMGIVKNDGAAQLWFTQYDSLNDRNERKEFFDYLHMYCKRKVGDRVFSQEYGERIESIVASDIAFVTTDVNLNRISYVYNDSYIYLCCFSKDPDSLAMWNYYTKSQHYEGYCVGFYPEDFRIANNLAKGYGIVLKEVVYSREVKDEILDKILLPFAEIFNNSSCEKKDVIIDYLAAELQQYQLVFKNRCFEHEKEVRAILKIPKGLTKDSPKISERKFRTDNGYIKPYVEYNVASNMIYSVTLPPLSNDETAIKNLKDFLASRGHNNVRSFSSAVPIRF